MATLLGMRASCIGLVEMEEALGGNVHGPVEERLSIKMIRRRSSKSTGTWYWTMIWLREDPISRRLGGACPITLEIKVGRPSRNWGSRVLRTSEAAIDTGEQKDEIININPSLSGLGSLSN